MLFRARQNCYVIDHLHAQKRAGQNQPWRRRKCKLPRLHGHFVRGAPSGERIEEFL